MKQETTDEFNLFSPEEMQRLDSVYEEAEKAKKEKQLKELRKNLDLVYFPNPATNNDLMLNLQYEYLKNGSEEAKSKLWVMAFQMVTSILKGELNRRKRLILSREEKEDKISKAVIDVMKRYEKIYYNGTPQQKKAKLYPFAYSVKNYVFQFQKAVQKQLGFIPYMEIEFEGLENMEAKEKENTNFEELMRGALEAHFQNSPIFSSLENEETMQACINFIREKAKETTEEKEIPLMVVYSWADDFLWGNMQEETQRAI